MANTLINDMEYNIENIFNKILTGKVPCNKVYENDKILAFSDINPKAKIHVLVIPKLQFTTFSDFTSKAETITVGEFFQSVNFVATNILKLKHFKLLINNGELAGQEVFHFHVHILSSGL